MDVAQAAPLTRRELREREAAALARGGDAAPSLESLFAAQAGAIQPQASQQQSQEQQSQVPQRQTEANPTSLASAAPASGSADLRASFPSRSEVAQSRGSRGSTRPAAAKNLGKAPIARAARRSFRDRAAAKLFSALAMLFAGALMVGTSVPANAFITGSPSGSTLAADSAEPQEKLPGQSVIVPADAAAPAAPRDAFTVMSYAEQLRLKYGNRSYSFKATTGAVRWPFPYPVPITDGWGERVSPCRGCSTFHQALDFTPGAGAPIYAIADGVVSHAEVTDGGLGNFVTIDHEINGVKVGSTYAHMQWGSSPLTVGSVVKVGDFVGLVGETGSAVGAHLHFELTVEGTKVDPFAWLTANAVD